MIQIPLHNETFRYLKTDFANWLAILGYSDSTVQHLPYNIHEFLCYLETQEVVDIHTISEAHFLSYYNHLSTRGNQRRGGGLSNAYLNKHKQALDRFADYLRKKAHILLPVIPLKSEIAEKKLPNFLTQPEIKELFLATEDYQDIIAQKNLSLSDIQAYASRDKAILTIFYSCGLRSHEGTQLNTSHIDLDSQVVYVSQGKGHKDRIVPFTKESRNILTEYLYDHRPEILKGHQTPAFFVSQRKTRMQAQSMAARLRVLQQRCPSPSLQQKNIHLHLLRHSIATHLLENGMSLEAISRFLGHQSLDSTQVYTHIQEEKNDG